MKMTTEEKNKLIAEFMGAKPTDHWKGNAYAYNIAPPNHSCLDWCIDEMQYHSDWNWFHSIWFKFISLKLTNVKDQLQHSEHKEYIQRAICYPESETPSEAFEALVKGIIWYNWIKK